MLRNHPHFLARITAVIIVLAAIREISIRRNIEAMSDWPTQHDPSLTDRP